MPEIQYSPELKNCTLKKFSFTSTDGFSQIAAYRFAVPGTPAAVLQISHGMCEYILRYASFADFLASHNIELWGHDHLGHGESAVTTDDLGFISENDGADRLIDDLHSMTLEIKKVHPAVPVFLMGHSMGSFVARNYIAKWGNEINGAVICGTGGPQSPAGAGKIMARTIELFCGKKHRSSLLKNIAFSGYTSRYEKGCDKNAWLTRDSSVVEKYNADPFCTFTFTTEAYYNLFDLLGRVSRKQWAASVPADLPVMIISGDDDPVGSWGKGVQTVYDRLKEAGIKDLSLHLYAGARHELLNETNRDEVMNDILLWMKERIPDAD